MDARGEYGHARHDEGQCPVGAECQWQTYQHQYVAGVHRMPHQSIKTGADDLLARRHLHGCRRVPVLNDHQNHHAQPNGYRNVTDQADHRWYR